MLARAPPPSIPFPARNKVCNRREIVRLFRNGVGGGGVVARDGFTRRPLKTSSAYEVVNDSTDEGFIVIRGGDQEKEFYPPPPSDLLSSSPSESERRSGSRSRGVTSSFGRLKAQKVKALVGKVTLKKKQQQRMSHNEEEDEDEDEDEDYSTDEGFGSSSILDLMRKKLAMKDVPRSGKSVETKEVKRFSKVSESREPRDLDRLGRDNDEDSEDDSYPQKFTDNERSGSRSSYSKGYGANSRDRGDRLSVAKDSDTYKRQDRVVDEVSNPRKFIDNEREGMRSSRGREDRRVVAKDSDTYQGRDRGTDEVSNARRFTGNERSRSNFSYSKDAESRGWGDRRSVVYGRDMEDWRERRKTNNSRETGFFSRKAFAEIGCSELMMKALKENNFDRPAHIQALAFAPVVDGKSCIIADQSGSGKTLAYLVPVIQRLREEELQGKSESSPGCPRVIVLVPTAELASQVLANCRLISKSGVPFRSMVMTGGFKQRTQLENLKQSVDVVIATPGRFMYLMKEGILGLSNLRCAILDEVDILFGDEEFETALQSLISSSPVTAQYLFVTATLPLEIYNKLVEVFPDCEVVMGPRVHRVSNALEEILVDCSGDDNAEKSPETAFLNKKNALLQIVEQTPVAKTIIFCNKIETCRKVENIFKRFDRKERQLHVLPFHAALEQESRLRNMEEFTSVHPEENSLFLVCTDRASRGIDFSGVDHVVLFDFPRDPSEYVRRVGRTARGARGEGKAFVFVVGKQVALARRILERNQKGHPVHDVPNAYEFTT